MPKVMLPLAAQPLWMPTDVLAAGPWEPVCAPVRLASAAASVSFASIPAAYVMFRLRCEIIKDATGNSISLRLNNDSGTNYNRQYIEGNNAAVTAARATGGNRIYLQNNGVDASAHATHDLVIAKPIAGSAGLVLNSGSVMTTSGIMLFSNAGIWANTADLINRIDVSSDSGNFAAGSIFYLEGSKF